MFLTVIWLRPMLPGTQQQQPQSLAGLWGPMLPRGWSGTGWILRCASLTAIRWSCATGAGPVAGPGTISMCQFSETWTLTGWLVVVFLGFVASSPNAVTEAKLHATTSPKIVFSKRRLTRPVRPGHRQRAFMATPWGWWRCDLERTTPSRGARECVPVKPFARRFPSDLWSAIP
jgi:hypothetical protein